MSVLLLLHLPLHLPLCCCTLLPHLPLPPPYSIGPCPCSPRPTPTHPSCAPVTPAPPPPQLTQARCTGTTQINEYTTAYDWADSGASKFAAAVYYNDTFGISRGTSPTVYQRIPQSVNLAINAWLKTITGGWGLGGGGGLGIQRLAADHHRWVVEVGEGGGLKGPGVVDGLPGGHGCVRRGSGA